MNILMPQLGETVAEGKITKWFKSAGDAVQPGDNLFEIETDKVSMEVPATEAGVLSEIRVSEGEIVPVGAIVAIIGGAGATVSSAPKPAPAAAQAPKTPAAPVTAAPASNQTPPPAAAPQKPIKLDPFFEVRTPARNFGPARLSGGITVTPLARRLATEAGIDLSRLRGSGPHGRIVAQDVASAPRPAAHAAISEGPGAEQVKALYEPGSYRGNSARRHAQDHCGAADAGEADHPAFLSDRRHHDRSPDRGARRSQCRCAQGSRRQSGVQALGQRFHHPRAGARAAARTGGERSLGRRSHSASHPFRHRRCGRH